LKAIHDPAGALRQGLADIREQFQLPEAFPPEVLAAADAAIARPLSEHVDRTNVPFVTLDPTSSHDLDQAFAIEADGGDLILHYAIADVGWFVRDGDPLDVEAWKRGTTIYLPTSKVPLYPPRMSEGAASLLPDDDRPAIIFTVRIDAAGEPRLDGAERALVRSRAKLGYATVQPEDLPPELPELSRRIAAAERARGAARVDPPQQLVEALPGARYSLGFRPMLPMEQDNAALSLAANLAIAKALVEHRTGLFRTMPEPGKRALKRLKHTAKALGVEWPQGMDLPTLERRLDPNNKVDATFMLAARRAGERASYAPFEEGVTPWHSAVAATYVHATAPLRRLADRYVCLATLAVANGRPVDEAVGKAFPELPKVMDKADSKAGQVESAAVELAESVVMSGHVGETFEAHVIEIDQRGAKLQLCNEPVITRLPGDGLSDGDVLELKLTEADPARRLTRFARA
jgi:exoribonuclease R